MSPIHAKEVLSSTFEKALVARPQRLTLRTPVRYRTKGLGHWHEGIVENLSHSGILLSGPQQLSEHTLVEMVLEMPERISGQKNSRVLCQGRIIRHTEVSESEFTGMAASVLDYKILPPKSGKGTHSGEVKRSVSAERKALTRRTCVLTVLGVHLPACPLGKGRSVWDFSLG